ncbi:MAG: 30S ribosome-binding factor RbfA [Candidatus Krumholzibacteria bacterium]|nr:30S ribosome-binding factor RbfA [Candidatus Krumholzibacteria bacterium]
MTKSFRIQRINEAIKELVSELLVSRIRDPRVGLVTITSVRVSRDLSFAKVYYSVMGDTAAREETRKGLTSAGSFLRNAISEELGMRTAPELRFVYDDTIDRSMRIEEKLREVGGSQAETGSGGGEDGDGDGD